jgi:hypothetical protein
MKTKILAFVKLKNIEERIYILCREDEGWIFRLAKDAFFGYSGHYKSAQNAIDAIKSESGVKLFAIPDDKGTVVNKFLVNL